MKTATSMVALEAQYIADVSDLTGQASGPVFPLLKEQKLKMVMVETGGDAAHAAARTAYEKAGFERYPVARYFREL